MHTFVTKKPTRKASPSKALQKRQSPCRKPQHSSTRKIALNSVKAAPLADPTGCETTGTCCGGGCGGKSDSTASAKKKAVCDPYGLDNKPLDIDTVNMQLEFVLENRWTYDTNSNTLTRTFPFSKTHLAPIAPTIPGAPQGPAHGPSAAFTFMQVINNIAVNNDHWPYALEVIPRKPAVRVDLKTVGRAGITHADINLATHIDAFYARHLDFKNSGV